MGIFLPKEARRTALWTDTKNSSQLKVPNAGVTYETQRHLMEDFQADNGLFGSITLRLHQIGSPPISGLPKTLNTFSTVGDGVVEVQSRLSSALLVVYGQICEDNWPGWGGSFSGHENRVKLPTDGLSIIAAGWSLLLVPCQKPKNSVEEKLPLPVVASVLTPCSCTTQSP